MMGCLLVTRETRYIHIIYLHMKKIDSWICIFTLPHVAIYFCSDEIVYRPFQMVGFWIIYVHLWGFVTSVLSTLKSLQNTRIYQTSALQAREMQYHTYIWSSLSALKCYLRIWIEQTFNSLYSILYFPHYEMSQCVSQ